MGRVSRVAAGRVRREVAVFDSYGRLSRVPESGELEKVETQLADNRRVIEGCGAVLGEELSDGLSAWKVGVRRPGWERLLERVCGGESDGIVVGHTDRLFRQPRDLEALIDLADQGFLVASACGAKDLSVPDDRFIPRIEVARAARSSDDARRRIKRRFATMRQNGVSPGSGRSFGWAGYDRTAAKGSPRVVVSAGLVERERAALRSGTRAGLAGVAMAQLAREWNEAGLCTITGKAWNGVSVREVLTRGRNAGLIEHDGAVVGRLPGEPIVAEADLLRLRALVAGRTPGRSAGGPGAVYVGSGILRCAVCAHPLSGRPHVGMYPDGRKRRQYACVKARGGCGKVAADTRSVDGQIQGFVIARLSDRRHAAALSAARARVADRWGEVEAEIGEIQRLQTALAQRLGRRDQRMSLEAFDAANEPLAADLARLEAERDCLPGGGPGGPVVAMSPGEVTALWDQAEVGERRGMFTTALAPGQMVITPADPGRARGRFDPDRVQYRPPTTHRV